MYTLKSLKFCFVYAWKVYGESELLQTYYSYWVENSYTGGHTGNFTIAMTKSPWSFFFPKILNQNIIFLKLHLRLSFLSNLINSLFICNSWNNMFLSILSFELKMFSNKNITLLSVLGYMITNTYRMYQRSVWSRI